VGTGFPQAAPDKEHKGAQEKWEPVLLVDAGRKRYSSLGLT
jgi:hypothetical protein